MRFEPTSQYAALAFVALVVVAIIAIIRFELLCLRDLAQRSDHELRHLTRAGWLAVIVFAVPVGGICYLYYGRPAG